MCFFTAEQCSQPKTPSLESGRQWVLTLCRLARPTQFMFNFHISCLVLANVRSILYSLCDLQHKTRTLALLDPTDLQLFLLLFK